MKTFTKGSLTTVVEDNDRRIPQYLESGWKETGTHPKQEDEADKRIGKAIDDVNASEDEKKGKSGSKTNSKGGKAAAPDKKVNDAIKANANAASESEEVDDGLLKKGGE